MFITPAFAQAAGGAPNDTLFQFIPFALIFIIMYFLILRPQQQKAKAHKAMVEALRRGDQVTLSGGLLGRVSKVIDENTLEIELAEGVKVKCMRGAVAEVRSKSEPADKA